ncbi:MAG: hypothetical protein P3W91_003665 [Fervidobacterium sp.]|nr:hypothetical protein [Fervidobacterium sp.]
MLLLCLSILLLSLVSAKAQDRCGRLKDITKKAHQEVIAHEYPWWYGLGLMRAETNCRWLTSSLDGHGSIGYAQITPKFLDHILRPLFPDYDKPFSSDHFYALAYLTKMELTKACRLWQVYQAYNGGGLVYRECRRANSCKHEDCKRECRRKDVCVWMTPQGCKQYRNACEINYSYSKKVYIYGQSYKEGEEKIIKFW